MVPCSRLHPLLQGGEALDVLRKLGVVPLNLGQVPRPVVWSCPIRRVWRSCPLGDDVPERAVPARRQEQGQPEALPRVAPALGVQEKHVHGGREGVGVGAPPQPLQEDRAHRGAVPGRPEGPQERVRSGRGELVEVASGPVHHEREEREEAPGRAPGSRPPSAAAAHSTKSLGSGGSSSAGRQAMFCRISDGVQAAKICTGRKGDAQPAEPTTLTLSPLTSSTRTMRPCMARTSESGASPIRL
mmetsp:Transcript_98901/g.304814  ORF Transcript_98901/g.304814 Transcript_98901/m.304814 type:complete len:243 (+) Transcript_98901:1011-1739(+)